MASPASNWREYVQQISIPRMLRTWAERHYGMVALIAETASEGIKLALFANWLLEPTSPDDILPKIAKERRLPRYPAETPAQHRARLHAAWTTWVQAGSHQNLIAQFGYAGWPGALVFDNVDIYQWEDPHDTANVSRFWVILPPGSHSFVSDGNWDDPGDWNDGGLWNSNATTEQIQTMRGIVRKWKPVDWKCEAIIAVTTWDDPTLVQTTNFAAVNWTKGVSTVISSDVEPGPTGGTFADQVTNSSGSPASTIYVAQTPGNVEAGRPTYFTLEAKAGTADWVAYNDGSSGVAWFNVATGVAGVSTGPILQKNIESIGNGYWRCTVVTDADPALAEWHVVSADAAVTCPAGAFAFFYRADVYSYKFGDHTILG
jgi:hypothetical protein